MKKFFSIINSILLVVALVLAGLLFYTKYYSSSWLDKFTDLFTSFINLDINKDKEVSTTIKFNKIDQYEYDNNDYTVYSPFDATILKTNESSIVLKCNNGYICLLENLINLRVFEFDVVKQDDELANFTHSFTMYFIKEDKMFAYEEII